MELRQHVSSLGLQLGLTSPTYITNNPTTAQTKDTKSKGKQRTKWVKNARKIEQIFYKSKSRQGEKERESVVHTLRMRHATG